MAIVSTRAGVSLSSGPNQADAHSARAEFNDEGDTQTSLKAAFTASASLSETGCDVAANVTASIDTAVNLGPSGDVTGFTFTGAYEGSASRTVTMNCESDARPNSTANVTFVVSGGSLSYKLDTSMTAAGALADVASIRLTRESPGYTPIATIAPPNADTQQGTLTPGTYVLSVILGGESQILPSSVPSISGSGAATVTLTLN